jgi:hypothetical protein
MSEELSFEKPRAHFCLVYDPAVANITPVLDDRFHPEEVVILTCPEKIEQAVWLENALNLRHMKIDHCSVSDAWDVAHIRGVVKEFLKNRSSNKPIALNVTGGTKPMTVAAYEAFREANLPIFYVHHENDHLVWMYHPKNLSSLDLFDNIQLPEFLMVHGAELVGTVNRTEIEGQWRALTTELIMQIDTFSTALSVLNMLASKAKKRRRVKFDTHMCNDNPVLLDQFKRLVDLFGKHKENNQKIVRLEYGELFFSSEKARAFINGGWLEEHVFGLLQKIKVELDAIKKKNPDENVIQDFGRNLNILKWNNGKPVKNELDVALLADNKLHIIECKTKKFDTVDGVDSHGADVLYKLRTLRDHIGGLQANAMLVSYKPLIDAHLWRAKELGIEICAGKDIQKLGARLKKWIQGT